MSQGMTVKGKTVAGQLVEILVDANGQLVTSTPYAQRISAPAVGITYVGKATVGSADGSAVWQIQKIDETSGTVITWANGNTSFNNIWSNRTALSYA